MRALILRKTSDGWEPETIGERRVWSVESVRQWQVGVVLLEESVVVVCRGGWVHVLGHWPGVRQEVSLVLGSID